MNSFTLQHIRKLTPYQAGEQSHSKKIIKLNTNENPYAPHPQIINTIKKIELKNLRKYPAIDKEKLLSVIALKYQLFPNQVIVGNGSDEIISAIFRTFIGQEKKLLLTELTYSAYFSYVQMYKSQLKIYPMKKWEIEVNQIAKLNFEVIFITNPNAPTGIAIDQLDLKKLIKKFPNRLFIIDEAYSDFHNQSMVQAIKTNKNLIVIKTLSKSYSLAGLRLGYAFSCPVMIESLKKVIDPYNINYLTQETAYTYLKSSPANNWAKRNIAKIKKSKKNFINFLNQRGFNTLPSQTNFILTSPSHHDQKEKNAKKLYLFLKKKNIFVRYFPASKLKNYIRITIGTDKEMEILKKKIKQFLHYP